MRVLLTGAAGFIGFHLANLLLAHGVEVVGLDNVNDYYDPKLKQDRLAVLEQHGGFRFARVDLADEKALDVAVAGFVPDVIVHLAAQAGVRYSLENPLAYIDSNVRGHLNMLELARRSDGLSHFIYASSSSVYGERSEVPFKETDRCDSPVSVYAATKKSGEMLTQSYCSLYGMKAIGLRFFTVYGPWGRPDMAYWLFTDAILNDRPIKLFNGGKMRRDFTDVRDVVAVMEKMISEAPAAAGHEIYNIGHSNPAQLSRFLTAIEASVGRKAIVEEVGMQPGDVRDTFADVSKLEQAYGYHPAIEIEDGIDVFVDWFRKYKNV